MDNLRFPCTYFFYDHQKVSPCLFLKTAKCQMVQYLKKKTLQLTLVAAIATIE
jgi:hypothetical protein